MFSAQVSSWNRARRPFRVYTPVPRPSCGRRTRLRSFLWATGRCACCWCRGRRGRSLRRWGGGPCWVGGVTGAARWRVGEASPSAVSQPCCISLQHKYNITIIDKYRILVPVYPSYTQHSGGLVGIVGRALHSWSRGMHWTWFESPHCYIQISCRPLGGNSTLSLRYIQ